MKEKPSPLPPTVYDRAASYGSEGWDRSSWYGEESVLPTDVRKNKDEVTEKRSDSTIGASLIAAILRQLDKFL